MISNSFADKITKGAYYLNNKHYKMGQEVRRDVKKGENNQIRLWVRDNFGADLSTAKLAKVARESSNIIKAKPKTHLANRWFYKDIKNGNYLMMGYTNVTTDVYSYITIKKRKNSWIYSCNGTTWKLLEEDEDEDCIARIGYDKVKFQFYNPKDKGTGFNKNSLVYGFLLIDE